MTLLLVAGLAAVGGGSSHADASFEAQAEAAAVDYTLTNAGIPVATTVQFAGPFASALLTSYGASQAVASHPYPGDVVAGLPGLLGSALGVPVSASYPGYVKAEAGDEPQEVRQPGFLLRAEAGVVLSSGLAESGAGEAGATASSRSTTSSLADGSIRATASTFANGFTLAGGLALDGVTSTATASRSPTGVLTRSSSTAIGRLVLPGGLVFGFADGSFFVAGVGTPIPTEQLVAAFKSVGYEVVVEEQQDYRDERGRVTGVRAPAVSIRTVVPAAPPTNQPSEISWRFGGTFAAVSFAQVPGAGGGTGGGGTTGAGTTGATSGGSSGGGTAAGGGTAGLGGTAGPGDVGSGAGGVSPSVQEPGAGGQPTALSPQVRVTPRTEELTNLYLVIVVGGLLALLGMQLIRLFGVRFLWNS